MSEHNPCSDAEWMLESIIDDFAESLNNRDRAQFYARLADLLAERRDSTERLQKDADEEPESPFQIH